MGSQSNKGSLRILDQAQFLGQSIRTQMPFVSPLLAEIYAVVPPTGDGEDAERVTDWDLVQLANAGLLVHASRLAFETSQVYRMRKVNLAELYRLRGQEVKVLSGLHARHRKSFLGSYDEELLPLMGLEVPGSLAYVAVRGRCQDSSRRMKISALLEKLGPPRDGTPVIDFGLMAQGMEDALAAYDTLVGNVEEALKLRDGAFIAHKEAESRLRRVYVNVARAQESFYRLAGLDELADRIRVTIPVRKPVSDDEPVSVDEPASVDEPVSVDEPAEPSP